MQLTIKQAEKAVMAVAVKHTSWQEAVGFRYRVFQVPGDFDITILPGDFELLFTNGSDKVICEKIDTYPENPKYQVPHYSN